MHTIEKALQLMENSELEKALKLLDSYEPTATDHEKFILAEFYVQWGFLNRAKNILQQLLKTYPDEGELKILLAHIYIEEHHDDLAIPLLSEIKPDDEAYLQALVQLADLYESQGLYEVAEQKLLTAKRIAPQEEIIDFALGELLFSIGKYHRAIPFYEKITTDVIANVSIYSRLAESYAAIGKYEVALDYFRDEEHENPDTLFKYGFTAAQANRNDIAIQMWEQLLKRDPLYYSVYAQLAKAYIEEKMPERAYRIAKKGLEKNEFDKELHFLAGKLANRLQKPSESERHVREALVLDPDYTEAVLFLIDLMKQRNDFSEVIDLIRDVQQTGTNDPLYDWELARAHYEMESYREALKYYEKAYTNLNQNGDFLKEYGYFLIEEGRTSEAIPVFESYLQIEPSDVEVYEFVERLKLD
ncbi:MAG TPA: tetratricopeptide repeat protein [Bacillota bacterium]|nr:tetratricopeptide repeat protein [Bacillota bacterium]